MLEAKRYRDSNKRQEMKLMHNYQNINDSDGMKQKNTLKAQVTRFQARKSSKLMSGVFQNRTSSNSSIKNIFNFS